MAIKVINIFGAPSSGKSTAAAGLFWLMKCNGMSTEFVSEYAKACVFENRLNLLKEDQLYIFAKQHRKLFIIKDTYQYAIMDSPLILSSIYLSDDSFYDREHFNDIVFSTFNRYDNLNFFIKLTNKFECQGRIHDLNQALEVEVKIQQVLNDRNIPFHIVEQEHAATEILQQIRGLS